MILEDPRLDFEVFTGTMPTTALLRLVLVTFNVLFDVFVLLVSWLSFSLADERGTFEEDVYKQSKRIHIKSDKLTFRKRKREKDEWVIRVYDMINKETSFHKHFAKKVLKNLQDILPI